MGLAIATDLDDKSYMENAQTSIFNADVEKEGFAKISPRIRAQQQDWSFPIDVS